MGTEKKSAEDSKVPRAEAVKESTKKKKHQKEPQDEKESIEQSAKLEAKDGHDLEEKDSIKDKNTPIAEPVKDADKNKETKEKIKSSKPKTISNAKGTDNDKNEKTKEDTSLTFKEMPSEEAVKEARDELDTKKNDNLRKEKVKTRIEEEEKEEY